MNTTSFCHTRLACALHVIGKILLLPLFSLLAVQLADGGSATWDQNPTSGDWNTAANWTPDTVPNGIGDTATFAFSNITDIFLSAKTEVNGIIFDPGASAFSITTSPRGDLTIGDSGVINNSGLVQNFVIANDSALEWAGSATPGADTVFTLTGSTGGAAPGYVIFFNGSSAGEATFVSEAGLASGGGGAYMQFYNHSTSGNGTFILHGGAVAGAGGGGIDFGTDGPPGPDAGNATFTIEGGSANSAYGAGVGFLCYTHAANATFNINGATSPTAFPGAVYFTCDATMDDATFIAKGGLNGGPGGLILATYGPLGGRARMNLSGNSMFDISGHDAPGMVIGSLEGHGGLVLLGSNTLSVGSNNRDTVFLGSLGDRGIAGGRGGALAKIGDGKLVLGGASRYTGDTHVQRGALLVKNTNGSATGDGDVYVDAGLLGGTGNIAGAVTVGTGSNRKAVLRPGEADDLLSIEKNLTVNSDGRFQLALDSDLATAGGVTAMGVTINNAIFELVDGGTATLSAGFTITAINNAAASVIAGTFSNLPDGSTITVGNNTYQADYEGGDGNDLTLTVVP